MLLTIHQVTPQTLTQLQVVNVHNGDNHELVQQTNEVISIHNHGNLQSQVTIYPKLVHLHQLQDLLVFNTNNQVPTSIWYPLI